LRKLNTESSIGISHQISVHLAKQFQRRRFLEIDQPEKMEQILEGIILCMQISRVKHMKLIANNRSQNFNISSNEENK
jgi:hypothetical protein